MMLKKIFSNLLFLSVLTTAYSQSYVIVEDQSKLKIETPSLADRKTRKLRLENGLEAYLISDPDTHQSGAALAVEVGSWDDPKERPGMAHFVEHMLFLGTEKFPEEEGYQRYIDEYGGNRNAYTAADRTVYIFSVNNNGFEEALDRFAQFFIAPLFSPSGVDRESKAIDQEFCKDLPLDSWRSHYVKKELANPEHPFHSFCIGNKETLTKISQDELKAWYHSHYSSDRMHLVVYSSLPLDDIEKQIVDLFTKVKKINAHIAPVSQAILSSQTAAKMVAVTPLQELQILELTWELPTAFGADKDARSDELVSYVLGHEGANSLLFHLKKEELAESLAAGAYHAGKNQGLFHLSIQLTSKGLENYEMVIQRCFEALASYRKTGIPKYIFEEIERRKTLEYAYQEREEIFSIVSELASSMVDEPLETFPHKSLMPTTYAPEKVKELLNLLNTDRCHFTLIAPPKLSHMKMPQKEKWMGVSYGLVPISQKQLTRWSQATPNPNIQLPLPNRFLPEKLTVKSDSISSELPLLPAPSLLIENEASTIYFCSDDRFFVPEISWIFTFKTPLVKDSDPRSHVMADLYCHAVQEHLNSVAYEAQLGGLNYALDTTHNGIRLKISGYNEKATAFLTTILEELKQIRPTVQEFRLYQDLAAREYLNKANKTPVSQGIELLWGILYKDYTGVNEKEKAVRTITYDDFSHFCQNVFQTAYVQGMLYGQQTQEDARSVGKLVQTKLIQTPFPLSRHPKVEIGNLPKEKGPNFIVRKSSLPGNVVLLAADCGDFSFRYRASQEILAKGIEEPFFSELRTRQQTAYLVTNWAQEIERHLYTFFLVQSGSHDTRDLLSRFELFIESSLQNLASTVVPKERFESIRNALITQHSHPAQKMDRMAEVLNTFAYEYDADFGWLEKRIQGLKDLTYEQFQEDAEAYLGKGNLRRLGICVNGSLAPQDQLRYRRFTTPQKIRGEISYKGRSLASSPNLVDNSVTKKEKK